MLRMPRLQCRPRLRAGRHDPQLVQPSRPGSSRPSGRL